MLEIKVKVSNKLSEAHTVRQGCPLSSTLFNIYMNGMIVK